MTNQRDARGPGERAEQALEEAARWHLLALLFERPRSGWLDTVQRLGAELPDCEAELTKVVRQASRADEGTYLATIGPGGLVSPREVAYRGFGDPGRILADLSGIYEAFAYRPRTEDPPDHVSVEAGFVGYLALKESYALAGGDDEQAELVAEARESFRVEHLGTFATKLARRLQGGPSPHLSGAAEILRDACGAPEAVANEPATAPPIAGVEDEQLSCGGELPIAPAPPRPPGDGVREG
jgi:nitrate reductase assembly molybdenum cofactor insertion protein NarJ